MTAVVSSRSGDVGVSGIVTARWPAPVRYALALGLLLVGIGALAAIDLVLLPRYFAASATVVSQAKSTGLAVSTVSVAHPEAVTPEPGPQPAQQPAAPPAAEPAEIGAPAAAAEPVAAAAAPAARRQAIPAFPPLRFAVKATGVSLRAERILKRVAEALKRDPSLHVVLDGHTDDLGSPEFNEILSLKRAQQCGSRLESDGIEPERIETHGFGAARPLDDGHSSRARYRNRRVEIELR